jgi:RNA polymerase sigma-70 factor (ECF subfamily)
MPDEREQLPPFERVYEQFSGPVFRFLLTQVRDRTVAEELGSDVFLSAHRAWERTPPAPDRIGAWLFTIARNRATDHFRRGAALRRLLDRLPLGAASDPEREVEMRAELTAALEAVNRLPRRARLAVGLRIGGGLAYAEIGTVLGVSERAAMMTVHRALARVRRELA